MMGTRRDEANGTDATASLDVPAAGADRSFAAGEFYREPEAVFWVYGFPLLMVVALGIAFRNQPERPIVVDVVDGAGAEAAEAGLAKNERFQVRRDALEACRVRLRLGKTDLVVITDEGASPRYDYWFDPGRPERRARETPSMTHCSARPDARTEFRLAIDR